MPHLKTTTRQQTTFGTATIRTESGSLGIANLNSSVAPECKSVSPNQIPRRTRMHKRESFLSGRSFTEACSYLQTTFFLRFEQQGVGGLIQELVPPRIAINESRKFEMTKALGKRMMLRITIDEADEGKTCITVASSLSILRHVVHTVLGSIATCGLAALVFGPLIYMKYGGFNLKCNFEN